MAAMMIGNAPYLILLALVGVGRLVELFISRRNQRQLGESGARKVHEPWFPWMVAVHVGVLFGAGVEVVLLERPLIPALAISMGLIFAGANALRWWVIHSLGENWNVQVMAGRNVVTSGPYRWIRHPNYVAVVAELFALPMIHTAWITALAVSAANLEILRRRIRVEEQALLANPAYRAGMGFKPRFVPKLF